MRANESKQEHRPPLNIAGAAEWCGTTTRHIQRMVAERRIPYFKLAGTSIRFDPDTLDEWLEAQPKHEALQPLSPVRVTRPLAVKKVAKVTDAHKRGTE